MFFKTNGCLCCCGRLLQWSTHGSFFLAKGIEGPRWFTQWAKIIFGPSNSNSSPHHEFKNK